MLCKICDFFIPDLYPRFRKKKIQNFSLFIKFFSSFLVIPDNTDYCYIENHFLSNNNGYDLGPCTIWRTGNLVFFIIDTSLHKLVVMFTELGIRLGTSGV